MSVNNVMSFVHGAGTNETDWSQDEKGGPQKALENAPGYYPGRFRQSGPITNPPVYPEKAIIGFADKWIHLLNKKVQINGA